MRLLLVMVDPIQVNPHNDNKNMDDGELHSDHDDDNDQVPGDPASGQHGPEDLGGGWRPVGPQGLVGPVAPVSISLHVKSHTFSARDDEVAESHLYTAVTRWTHKVLQKKQNVVSFAYPSWWSPLMASISNPCGKWLE